MQGGEDACLESKKRFCYRLDEVCIEKLEFLDDKTASFVKAYIKSSPFKKLIRDKNGGKAANVTLLHSDIYNRQIEDLDLDIDLIEGLGTTWLITSEDRFDEFREGIEDDL
jgi:hypothetical protein